MLAEVVLFLLLLLIMAVWKDRKPKNMPPGPPEIPFIGSGFLDTTETFKKFRDKYGPVYTTRIGNERTVVISDYELAKEAMSRVECSGRSPIFKVLALYPKEDRGIVFSNGMNWLHNRRLINRNLRDLGMGKSHLQNSIQFEAEEMVKSLKEISHKPTTTPPCIRRVVFNVIWQMVAGKRYDLTSPDLDKIIDMFESIKDISTIGVFIQEFFPILKFVPNSFWYWLLNLKLLDEFKEECVRLFRKCYQEHEKNLDEENPKDLIDDYLIAMKQNKDDPDSMFREEDLFEILDDLFFAGTDTVTNSLQWVVFLMVKYPEITKKAQKEIDEIVPRDRLVSMEDKPRLPYVEAYMAEALRFSSLVFMNLARCTNKDYKLANFHIPKGTSVTVDNFFIHHDPKYWKDPTVFSPERFIDENGKFNAKLGRNFAFGSGKRECIGLPLAMMELFLFSSALIQNFTVELHEGEKALDEKFTESIGLRTAPVTQKYVYKYRPF